MATTLRSWQLKAQRRRRTLQHAPHARDRRDCLLFICIALAACVLGALLLTTTNSRSDDDTRDTTRRRHTLFESLASRVLCFVRAYPQRFYAFYAPKIELLGQWMLAAVDAVELSEDASASLDFAVAFVSVVSVYHVIEIGRHALLSRLQRAQTSSRDDYKRNEDARTCDAY